MESDSIGRPYMLQNVWTKFDPVAHGLPADFVLTNFTKLKG